MTQGESSKITIKEVREKTEELVVLIAPLIRGRDLTIVAGVMLAVADSVVSAVSHTASQEERAQIDYQIRAVLSLAQHCLSTKVTVL